MITGAKSPAPRRGFTLAEMLVALGILMVLIALSAAALMRFGNLGPMMATKSNMDKVKALLDTQWKAVSDAAQKESIGSPSPKDRAARLNDRLLQAFPHSFVEVMKFPPGQIGAHQPYKKYLESLGVSPANCDNMTMFPADVQQGVCLMMILERGPFNQGTTPDVLGTTATQRIAINGINVYAIADAWGNRMLFTRNYKKAPNTLALMAMGKDRQAGVNVVLLNSDLTKAPNPMDHDLAKSDPAKAADNVTTDPKFDPDSPN